MREINLTWEGQRANVRVYGWDHDAEDMGWLYIGSINSEGKWEGLMTAESSSDEERGEAKRLWLSGGDGDKEQGRG